MNMREIYSNCHGTKDQNVFYKKIKLHEIQCHSITSQCKWCSSIADFRTNRMHKLSGMRRNWRASFFCSRKQKDKKKTPKQMCYVVKANQDFPFDYSNHHTIAFSRSSVCVALLSLLFLLACFVIVIGLLFDAFSFSSLAPCSRCSIQTIVSACV